VISSPSSYFLRRFAWNPRSAAAQRDFRLRPGTFEFWRSEEPENSLFPTTEHRGDTTMHVPRSAIGRDRRIPYTAIRISHVALQHITRLFVDPSYPEGNFRWNQLLGGSMSLSPLYRTLTNDLHVSTACRRPPPFLVASSWHGIDHHLSGPAASTLGPPAVIVDRVRRPSPGGRRSELFF